MIQPSKEKEEKKNITGTVQIEEVEISKQETMHLELVTDFP